MPVVVLAQESARASIDAGVNELLSESLDGVSCRHQRCNRAEKYHEPETEAKWDWSCTERPLNGLPLQDPAVIAAGARKLVAFGVNKAKKQIELTEFVSELSLEICCLATSWTMLLFRRAKRDDSLSLSNHEHHDDLP